MGYENETYTETFGHFEVEVETNPNGDGASSGAVIGSGPYEGWGASLAFLEGTGTVYDDETGLDEKAVPDSVIDEIMNWAWSVGY